MNSNHTPVLIGLGLAAAFSAAEARDDIVGSIPIQTASGQELEYSGIMSFTDFRALTAHTVPNLQNAHPGQVMFPGIQPRSAFGTEAPQSTWDNITPRIAGTFSLGDPRKDGINLLTLPQGSLYGNYATSGFSGFLGAGYTGNRTHEPVTGESSGTISAGLSYQDTVDLGPGKLSYGLAAALTYYDNAFDGWPGDDRYLHDFGAYFSYQQELSQSAQLDVRATLNYGDHGSVARGYNWAGPLEYPVFDFDSDASVTWRPDGKALDSPGIVLRSGIQVGGYDEKEGDFADSVRYAFTQEVFYIPGTSTALYLRARGGNRQFEEMTDYDSSYYDATMGIVRPLPCGTTLRAGIGMERINYQGDNLDDRTDLTAELLLRGNIGRGEFSAGAEYRTFRNFANWGGGDGVDMRGLQFGARVTHPITDALNIRFALESSHLNAASSDNADGTLSYQSGTIGLGWRLDDRTNIDFLFGLNRASVDNGGGSNNDTYGSYAVRVYRTF